MNDAHACADRPTMLLIDGSSYLYRAYHAMADLRGPDRSPAVVAVRDDAIWRLRRLGWSLPRIGRFIFRHHTTVMEALARRERRVSDVQV